jgi:hypothetical protein
MINPRCDREGSGSQPVNGNALRLELPPPTRQKTEHKPAAEQLEALQTIPDEAERMEKLAVDLRQRLLGVGLCPEPMWLIFAMSRVSGASLWGTMAAVVDDREDVYAGDVNSVRRGALRICYSSAPITGDLSWLC